MATRYGVTVKRSRKKNRLDELKEEANERGLDVETWSPGDGATRYRFFRLSEIDPKQQTYFGPKSGIHTALGLKKAYAFLYKGDY